MNTLEAVMNKRGNFRLMKVRGRNGPAERWQKKLLVKMGFKMELMGNLRYQIAKELIERHKREYWQNPGYGPVR